MSKRDLGCGWFVHKQYCYLYRERDGETLQLPRRQSHVAKYLASKGHREPSDTSGTKGAE